MRRAALERPRTLHVWRQHLTGDLTLQQLRATDAERDGLLEYVSVDRWNFLRLLRAFGSLVINTSQERNASG
jgi:hypothetical protein